MSEILTEQEQIQAIKKWFQENGMQLILSVVVVGGGYLGWNAWIAHKEAKLSAAAEKYQEFTQLSDLIVPSSEVSEQNIQSAKVLATELIDEDKAGLYGVMSILELARIEIENGRLEEALVFMDRAIAENEDAGLAQIIQLRKAKILQAQGKYDEALVLLENPEPSFAANYAWLRGSIYQSKGLHEEAVAAYRESQSLLPADQAGFANFLQILIDHLAVQVTTAAQ